MDVNDAWDMMEPEAGDRFKRRTAVTIAIIAMLANPGTTPGRRQYENILSLQINTKL